MTARAHRLMVAVGWTTIGAFVLLVGTGLLIGAGGPLPPSPSAAEAAAALARIAPWPVLLPLGVVLLVVARRAIDGPGWPRTVAIATSAVLLGFGLLGAPWSLAGPWGGAVLVGKLAWVAANGYVLVALLSARGGELRT